MPVACSIFGPTLTKVWVNMCAIVLHLVLVHVSGEASVHCSNQTQRLAEHQDMMETQDAISTILYEWKFPTAAFGKLRRRPSQLFFHKLQYLHWAGKQVYSFQSLPNRYDFFLAISETPLHIFFCQALRPSWFVLQVKLHSRIENLPLNQKVSIFTT